MPAMAAENAWRGVVAASRHPAARYYAYVAINLTLSLQHVRPISCSESVCGTACSPNQVLVSVETLPLQVISNAATVQHHVRRSFFLYCG
jgi:hypothetical protein